MIRVAAFLGLLGLAGATALFLWQGVGPVASTFATAGFGIVWAGLFHFVSMGCNGRAWQVLLPANRRATWSLFVWAVWLRESVNGLLPVARIGGEVASTQLLIKRGLRAPRVVASLVVDMTVSLASQFVFTVVGLAFLVPRDVASGSIVYALMLALGAAIVLGGAFLLVQRVGFFGLLARIARALFGDRFASLVGGAAPLDRAVRALYYRRDAILVCFLWQLLGWFAGAAEIGIALYFLGRQPSFADAVIIESVIQALSSVAFLVPGALGVQEGGFLAIGTLIGLTPEVALALALARRARDILVFAPALLFWQFNLGRRLLARV